jgi:hypothetical protein
MRKSYVDGKHYRDRAEQFRTAAQLVTAEARTQMLKVAANYDRMAEIAEMLPEYNAETD